MEMPSKSVAQVATITGVMDVTEQSVNAKLHIRSNAGNIQVTLFLTRSLQPEIWHAFLNNRTFILRFNMRSIRVRDNYQEISNMYPALLFSDPTCGQFGLDINTVNGTSKNQEGGYKESMAIV